MTGTRAVIWVAAGILALVVAAVVVVLLAGTRPPVTFPPDSPQAAMQGYLAAWEERDLERAYGSFSSDIKARVTLDEYESSVRGYGEVAPGEEAVYIDAAEGSGDQVTLHLTVEHYVDYGGGPGADTYRSETTVRMVRESDGWKIDDQLIGAEPGAFVDEPAF